MEENGSYEHIEELDDIDIKWILEDLAEDSDYAFLQDSEYRALRERIAKFLPHKHTPYEKMLAWAAEANGYQKKNKVFTVDGKKSILAMARSNDPFYSGQPGQLEGALWFAEFHQQYVGRRRFHIRFLFYLATGEEPDPETGEFFTTYSPDGSEFVKNEENWQWFQLVSKWARNLEMVDPSLIIDRRRYKATHNAPTESPPEPSADFTGPDIELPTARSFSSSVEYASGMSLGYHFDPSMHPSIIELWIEKEIDEEDNPVIRDFCRREGINLIEGTGYMTISAMHALLQRRAELGKPVRILYLADFDDAGQFMALGPARHIEYAIRNMNPRPDIKLHHLALSAQQVIEENIPRKIPKTKKEEEQQKEEKDARRNGRKENFEARHGAGTVQLNALTVNPVRLWWLTDLLRDTVRSLRDPEIEEKIDQAEEEADRILEAEIENKFRWVHRAYEMLVERADETREGERAKTEEERQAIEKRRSELHFLLRLLSRRQDELDEEVDAALEPIVERAERVRHVAQVRLDRVEQEIELPRVETEEPEGATEDWLFVSERSYFDQHSYYNRHKQMPSV